MPPDDFMKRTEDQDEAFTFRRPEQDIPSDKLEEVVSASILRVAKEKFLERRLGETPPSPSAGGVKIKPEPVSSGNESLPSEDESEDGGETMDPNEAPGGQTRQRTRAPVMTFTPAVATDDDVSYELIRPSARSILEKLDRTLSILHNARMTSAQNLMDSEGGSSSEDHDEHGEEKETPRSRHMSRTSAADRETTTATTATTAINTKKSNRGRPCKYVQMEGESEKDFLLRRALAQKKKRPASAPPPDDEGEGDDEHGATTTAAAEDGKEPPPLSSINSSSSSRLRRKRRRARRPESMTEEEEYWMQRKMERLNLRDWSDVMGAAALAGFSPRVVARATQRCADLFGQGMAMHTVEETAASSGPHGIETRRYGPGGVVSPSSSGSDDGDEVLGIRQARSMSRQTSVAPRRAVSFALSDGEDEEGGSSKKRQKRSSSRGAATGQNYCPYANCSRALKGFGRPFNLKRHLKLVHGQDSMDEAKRDAVEEEEDDDLDGGVHRDGFLEPVRIQKGWRAEDTRPRAARRTARKRQRDESSSEDDESVSGSGDSGESESDSEG